MIAKDSDIVVGLKVRCVFNCTAQGEVGTVIEVNRTTSGTLIRFFVRWDGELANTYDFGWSFASSMEILDPAFIDDLRQRQLHALKYL